MINYSATNFWPQISKVSSTFHVNDPLPVQIDLKRYFFSIVWPVLKFAEFTKTISSSWFLRNFKM